MNCSEMPTLISAPLPMPSVAPACNCKMAVPVACEPPTGSLLKVSSRQCIVEQHMLLFNLIWLGITSQRLFSPPQGFGSMTMLFQCIWLGNTSQRVCGRPQGLGSMIDGFPPHLARHHLPAPLWSAVDHHHGTAACGIGLTCAASVCRGSLHSLPCTSGTWLLCCLRTWLCRAS